MGTRPFANHLDYTKLSRRELFQLSLMSAGATLIGGRRAWGQTGVCIDQVPHDIDVVTGLSAIEVFPTSPFILSPFTDPLPIPSAMRP